MEIIIKNSKNEWNSNRKDYLHRRRKEIEIDLRSTIFSKEKMNMIDCKTEAEEGKRVADYDKWKAAKDSSNKTNEEKLKEFSDINREFKKHGEEGNVHSPDQLRIPKPIKYN